MNKFRKKILAALAATVVSVVGASTAASAWYVLPGNHGYTDRYVSVDGTLNFRTAPSTDAPVIASLYNGTYVELVGEVYESRGVESPFVCVLYNGIEGFVSSDYLLTVNPTTYNYSDDSGWGEGSYVIGTVIYPRIDKLLSNGNYSTWCSLNTDGLYYNEYGQGFSVNWDGTFSDAYGNIFYQIG